MLPIFAPIAENDTGPGVQNLQGGLLALIEAGLMALQNANAASLEQALRKEYENRAYGAATSAVVQIFQAANMLPVSGEVDTVTAAALNKQLDSLARSPREQAGLWVISGQVRDGALVVAPGMTAAAYQYCHPGAGVLGRSPVDSDGSYRITFDDAAFRNTAGGSFVPSLFVRVFDANSALLATSEVISQAQRHITLDILIDRALRLVRGRIADPAGFPLAGLRVRAQDCDMLGNHERLGEAQSDGQGLFRIPYTLAQIAAAEIASADVMVSVLNADGQQIAASEVLFNCPADQIIDITVPRESYRGASEHERYRSGLLRLAGKFPLGQLTDAQLTFAASETGIPHVYLEFLRRDESWTSSRGLEHGILYGLLRQGLPGDERQLLSQPPPRLRAALELSAQTNILPLFASGQLDSIMARLFDAAVALAFEHEPDAKSAPPLGVVLATAPLGPEVQRRVVEFSLQHQGEDDFWVALEETVELSPDDLNTVRFSMEASRLLYEHLPTLQAVQQLRRERGLKGTAIDLVSLSPNDWQLIAARSTSAQMPDGFQNRDTFVKGILHRLEQSFPTAVFARRMAERNAPSDRDMLSFLAHNPSFDLLHTTINTFLDQDAELGQVQDRARLGDQVRTLGRVARLIPDVPDHNRFDLTQALLANGYDSALKIARSDQASFIGKMTPIAGAPIAHQLIANARARADAANFHLLNLGNLLQQPVASLPRITFLTGKAPDWAGMFGTLNSCACKHCRSVNSPAAYMVDLLQFLQQVCLRAGSSGACERTLRDAFFARRPDVGHLLLNCDNANTALPYIDLVNEVLEEAVASTGPDGHYEAPPAIAVPGRAATAEELAEYRRQIARFQTSNHSAAGRTQAEHEAALRAQPEHFSEAAARKLAAATFPWNLPYREDQEQAWLLAEHLSLPLDEVITLFHTVDETDSLTQAQIARAALHVTPEEWNLLTGPSSADPLGMWGGTDAAALASLPVFLDHSALTYSDVEALVHSSFFSQGGTPQLRIEPGADRCDINTFHLRGLDGAGVLDRLHRFLRLRRKLDWSIDALDDLLAALGHTTIDEAVMLDAHRLRTVAGRLELGAAAAIALFRLPHGSDEESEARKRAWARALRLKDNELMLLDRLGGDVLGGPAAATPATVLRLVALRDAIEQSGFPIAELAYLLLHEDQAPAFFAPRSADLRAFLLGLHRLVADTSADKLRLAEAEIANAVRDFEQGFPAPTAEAIAARRTALQAEHRRRLAGETELTVLANLADFVGLDVDVTARLINNTTGPDGATVVAPLLRAVSGASPPAPALADFLVFLQLDAAAGGIDLSATPAFGHARDLLIRLLKTARVTAQFGLGTNEVAAIQAARAANDFLDFNDLPFEHSGATAAQRLALGARWQALVAAFTLRKALPASDGDVFSFILHPGLAGSRPAQLRTPEAYAYLSEHTGWLAEDLAALQPGFDFSGADFQRVDTYRRMATAVAWLRRWKMSAAALVQMAAPSESRAATRALIATLLALLRSKHDNDAARFAVLAPLMDVLREKKRDALLACLIHHRLADGSPARRFADPGDVYAHYLIDVGMSACQLSSRIVQANGAIQLFVQRCLMNLEHPEVSLRDGGDPQFWSQWDWMKNYRVWEANRKVFLYPENWIEPELRDDKSPFFEELESELLQNEVTPENLELAFRNYFSKLDEVDRLDVCGVVDEALEDGRQIVHVVARTHSEPHRYYYRKRCADRIWSAWERIDLSIEGDHLMPVIYNGHLILFWAVFSQQDVYWNLNLHWSVHRSGAWDAPRSGAKSYLLRLGLTRLLGGFKPQHFTFRTTRDEASGALVFWLFTTVGAIRRASERGPTATRLLASLAGTWNPFAIASFRFDPCTLALKLDKAVSRIKHALAPQVVNYAFDSSGFIVDAAGPTPLDPGVTPLGTGDLQLPSPVEIRDDTLTELQFLGIETAFRTSTERRGWTRNPTLLAQFGHRFELLGAVHDVNFDIASPFFIEGSGRSYMVSQRGQMKGGCWTSLRYQFENFYHPYFCQIAQRFNALGLDGVYRAPESDFFMHRQLYKEGGSGEPRLAPLRPRFSDFGPGDLVWRDTADAYYPYPYEQFEFARDSAYALYNWELFFHIPLLVADRLSKNQRFAEAQRWFHYIFDPTDVSHHPDTVKCWQTKPFFEEAGKWDGPAESLEDMLRRLAIGSEEVEQQVAAWRENPFNPHLIARMRLLAYMKTVVMKYLDNLIAWADHLFLSDTMESVNEAAQLYVMAAGILGERPLTLERDDNSDRSFHQIDASYDAFSNALIELEANVPGGCNTALPRQGRGIPPNLVLYFCVPQNDKLLGYWDTVADRLFKIRHCMDIEGRMRQLALFAPPIDPALLVRARAAGLDLRDVISGQRQLPHHRFALLVQKALEFCSEVRSLGSALLSTLEKKDGEQLSLLRTGHELALLQRLTEIKQQQNDEAQQSLEALRASRLLARTRETFYTAKASEYLNSAERTQLAKLTEAHQYSLLSQTFRLSAAIAHATPDFLGPAPHTGGSHVGHGLNAVAAAAEIVATQYTFDANMAAISAGHDRRRDEWRLQADLAVKELAQIDKQIVAAEIRQQMARADLNNHEQQVVQVDETRTFLESKFSNTQLYSWMTSQVSTLYYQSYNMAYRLSRMAERAAEYELGLAPGDLAILEVGASHWDSARKGLLAGERLYQDLQRLESAYLERNTRTLEITKHVSLRQVDPLALMTLRHDGECSFNVPKVLFDLDFPGHERRRMKSVSLSLPCVVGPYTSVSGTLTLLDYLDDSGASGATIPVSSIATSTGQYDAGVFELNFRDERYLPFEGAGVDSHWRFTLPKEFPCFDYDTISDLILHIRYTARDNPAIRESTVASMREGLDSLGAGTGSPGLKLLISIRHDFSADWRALQGAGDATAARTIVIGAALFPFFVRGRFEITAVNALTPEGALDPVNMMAEATSGAESTATVDITREHEYLVASYTLAATA